MLFTEPLDQLMNFLNLLLTNADKPGIVPSAVQKSEIKEEIGWQMHKVTMFYDILQHEMNEKQIHTAHSTAISLFINIAGEAAIIFFKIFQLIELYDVAKFLEEEKTFLDHAGYIWLLKIIRTRRNHCTTEPWYHSSSDMNCKTIQCRNILQQMKESNTSSKTVKQRTKIALRTNNPESVDHEWIWVNLKKDDELFLQMFTKTFKGLTCFLEKHDSHIPSHYYRVAKK